MAKEDKELMPFRAEISATAKANLDIKGEISTSALDRLANAFADAISPFTESRGLKGDLIRLNRQEVALKVAENARRQIENEGNTLKTIPNKILIPIFEKASLEHPDDKMVEWWSSLLASTSSNVDMQHPIYSDILGKMTRHEVVFLDKLAKDFIRAPYSLNNLEIDIESVFAATVTAPLLDYLYNISEDARHSRTSGESERIYVEKTIELLNSCVNRMRSCACIIISTKYDAANYSYKEDIKKLANGNVSALEIIDVLTSLGLFRRQYSQVVMPADFIGEFSASMEICHLTSLGRKLLRACIRD